MKTITLTNEYGDTIVVSRQRGGRIMLQHSDLTRSNQWGEYVDADLTDTSRPSAGALVVEGHPYLLSPQEVGLIRGAISQMAERQRGTADVLEALARAANCYAQGARMRAIPG